MGAPSQREEEDGLEKGPVSPSLQLQTAILGQLPGVSFVTLLNAGMLLIG